jgi:hypothetical protein
MVRTPSGILVAEALPPTTHCGLALGRWLNRRIARGRAAAAPGRRSGRTIREN